MTVLVAGATGRIGAATVEALVGAGHEPVAMIRSRDRAVALSKPLQTRVGDLSVPKSLLEAFDLVDTLLLCSGHAPTLLEHQLNAISAAQETGIRRIVKISASPASAFPDTPSVAARQHLAIEAALTESGIEHTNIRPNAFAQFIGGFADTIAAGTLPMTLGAAGVSWVDTRDVGAVAAAALVTTEPLPRVIEVTGPESLTGEDLAAALSRGVNRSVIYMPISDEENRARLEAQGVPEWLVEHVTVIFGLLRDRDGGRVTQGVRQFVGRAATPFSVVIERDRHQLGLVRSSLEPDERRTKGSG